VAKLTDDIKVNGVQETVKYVERNGTKYIVDGHHRVIAAKRLGITEIPIEKVSLPYKGYNTINDVYWID
jgi:Predicted transcriptional regulators